MTYEALRIELDRPAVEPLRLVVIAQQVVHVAEIVGNLRIDRIQVVSFPVTDQRRRIVLLLEQAPGLGAAGGGDLAHRLLDGRGHPAGATVDRFGEDVVDRQARVRRSGAGVIGGSGRCCDEHEQQRERAPHDRVSSLTLSPS
jgi:hypothetical protein